MLHVSPFVFPLVFLVLVVQIVENPQNQGPDGLISPFGDALDHPVLFVVYSDVDLFHRMPNSCKNTLSSVSCCLSPQIILVHALVRNRQFFALVMAT